MINFLTKFIEFLINIFGLLIGLLIFPSLLWFSASPTEDDFQWLEKRKSSPLPHGHPPYSFESLPIVSLVLLLLTIVVYFFFFLSFYYDEICKYASETWKKLGNKVKKDYWENLTEIEKQITRFTYVKHTGLVASLIGAGLALKSENEILSKSSGYIAFISGAIGLSSEIVKDFILEPQKKKLEKKSQSKDSPTTDTGESSQTRVNSEASREVRRRNTRDSTQKEEKKQTDYESSEEISEVDLGTLGERRGNIITEEEEQFENRIETPPNTSANHSRI